MLGGPFGELVGVLAGSEDERHLFAGDVRVVDPHLVGGGGSVLRGGLRLGRDG